MRKIFTNSSLKPKELLKCIVHLNIVQHIIHANIELILVAVMKIVKQKASPLPRFP